MTAEWVAPVATGAVGIVGIVATFWTARQSRRTAESDAAAAREHERTMRLRDERRQAYATFLAHVEEERPFYSMVSPLPTPSTFVIMFILVLRVVKFRRAMADVLLVASPEVAAHLESLRTAMPSSPPLFPSARKEVDEAIGAAVGALRNAMQRDLGYTLGGVDQSR